MNAIYKFVLGMIGKRSGVVTTLPSQKQIEFQANMLAEKFMQNGIDPNALKSPEQVKNVLANIDQANMRVIPADSSEGRGITKALGIGKKADVMDMKGNKINTSKGIMGGEEIKTSTSDADMIIKNIKSMEPMDAMKEANSVIGRKGKYKNLTEEQSKKILKDTEDHIFERDIPEDPEDFAIGGRVGLKGGAFLNFIKNLGKGMNNKSPLQAYKDYLKSVKDRAQKGDMKTLAPEMGIIAGGGILTNRFLKKKLEKMTEDVKAEVEKKADGGRIGFFTGMRAQEQKEKAASNREDRRVSQYKSTRAKAPPSMGFRNPPPSGRDDGPDNRPTVLAPETKNIIRKTANTAGDISYFKNLIELNPAGIVKNIGGKIILDKIFGDQSKLNTEEEDDTGIMQMADVSAADINRLIDPVSKKPKYSSSQDVDDIRMFEDAAGFEFNPTMTDQEIRDVLDKKITRPTGQFAADGGRIGYKAGSVDKMRRLILKTIGAGTAGIAGAKSGIFSFGKGPAKEVAKEVVKQSAGTPPPYFFKLAEKIKMMGDDATATTDRTIAKTLKSKDGKSTYVLEEDLTSGDTIIKKINKEGDEMITDVQIMELRKGEIVQTKDGKALKTPDEYEEVTEANARIEGDTFNDPYYSDGIEEIEMKKIIDEVDDTTPSIKYASGGRAGYFKGGLAALKTLLNYFAKEKGTTGSKLLSDINPRKIDSGIKNLMSKEELNQLKENRTEYVKNLLNIIKSDKKFLDNNKELVEEAIAQAPIGMEDFAKEMADSIKRSAMKENRLERLSVYDKVNPDDAIMDVEMMIKNMSTGKDKRALNATGGLAYMLGE